MSTTSRTDPYRVLGVEPGASQVEIREAYRRLAPLVHPDRNPSDPGAEARFKELAAAYGILADPGKRAGIDASRERETARTPYHKPRSNVAGFFSNLRQAAGPWPRRGGELRYTLDIDLSDVAHGGVFEVELPRQEACPACSETEARNTCRVCGGTGAVLLKRLLQVDIPAGVRNGERLVFEGEGDAGIFGGKPGDLFVDIGYRRHPFFEVAGTDLVCQIPIPFPLATLGGEIEVPTLEDPVNVNILPGTQPGRVLRLENRGLRDTQRQARGDILVTLFPEIPTSLGNEAARLVAVFRDSTSPRAYPRSEEYRRRLADYSARGVHHES